ncbi:hypothetical protein E4U55_003582 [Claviceps digitariae]|nr:hypothetical protein E4U55_003582 [Claviceps digitariae]
MYHLRFGHRQAGGNIFVKGQYQQPGLNRDDHRSGTGSPHFASQLAICRVVAGPSALADVDHSYEELNGKVSHNARVRFLAYTVKAVAPGPGGDFEHFSVSNTKFAA